MDSQSLRQRFLDHLRAHGHAIIGGAPLIPEHDPSVLFTTAGMHPLVPFLLGEPHPAGPRLANVQRCLRTNDILEVGDAHHLTFFEMLGNWSLGDYWKDEAIRLSYAFLTERLGLDPARLYVTCFAGDADAPRDDEAAAVWRSLGLPEECILFLPKEDNWWGPAGATGPCGPDSEMFYDTQPAGPPGETPVSNPGRFWEVGNNVFMQYDKQPDGSFRRLAQHNVDLGMGLERLLPIVQGVPSIYETDLFAPIVGAIRALATRDDPFAVRVVADHIRAAVFVLAEGVTPGNVDQRYIARRLIRRAVRYGRELGIDRPFLAELAGVVIATLADTYPELERMRGPIGAALAAEEARFQRTLARGEAEFNKAIAVGAGGEAV
jgi:alanyl-tRNA synthetase